MNQLQTLFEQYTHEQLLTITELSAAGSNRRYFRLTGESVVLIGVEGTSVDENKAFISMSRHFSALGLPVPKVYASSSDARFYIQDDLGNTLLFDLMADARQTGVYGEDDKRLVHETLRLLPVMQVKGARGFDFSVCYPQPTGRRF